VRPAQLANQRLDLGQDPPRMLSGRVGPVGQAIKTLSPITGHPTMHGLPDDAVSFGDFDDRSARQDLQHGTVSLLDHIQFPKHERERRASSEATVLHIKRSRPHLAILSCSGVA
jgi:hypothetical protein